MTLLGANIDGLLSCVAEVQRHRRRVREATHRMEVLVQQAQWVGPDRERFVEHWTTQYRPLLYSVLQELADEGRQLQRHAERQRAASER